MKHESDQIGEEFIRRVGDSYLDGRDAFGEHWMTRGSVKVDDPLTREFARGVVDEFIERWSGSGLAGEALEGGRAKAGEKHVEPLDALLELLQNADDQRATEATMLLDDGKLLFVHNGSRVTMPDVSAIVMPYLSTKRGDAAAIGRFGIGLKTLVALGDDLAVHSAPYHFIATPTGPAGVAAAAPIDGIYDGSSSQTLFVLSLRDGSLDPDALHEWAGTLGPAGIVFLASLTDFTVVAGGRRTTIHAGRLRRSTHAVGDDERVIAAQVTGGGGWTVYTQRVSPPAELVPADKARDEHVTVGIAISNGADGGRICIGLPLECRTAMPASLQAPFDPDDARRDLRRTAWNEWLFGQLAILTGHVVRLRYADRPDRVWRAIPLRDEVGTEHSWLAEQLGRLHTAAVDALAELSFQPPDPDEDLLGFDDATYEPAWVTSVVEPELLTLVQRGVVPRDTRDRPGRWRRVLRDTRLGAALAAEDVLELAESEADAVRGLPVEWWRLLTATFLEHKQRAAIERARVLVLDDETRMSAVEVDAGRILTTWAKDTHVPVLAQLHPDFLTGRGSGDVSSWLVGTGRLVEEPSDRRLIEALAGWDGQPLPLDDGAVLWLQRALWQLDEDDRVDLANRVGGRITLDGYHYEAGARVRTPVVPREAYLPSTVTHRGDSFAKAAAETQGLVWVNARYDRLIRSDKTQDVGGALATLRLLGGRSSPPLEARSSGAINRYVGTPADRIQLQAGRLQTRALGSLRRTPEALQQDRESPHLTAVAANIASEADDDTRTARARALFMTLCREWEAEYSKHLTAGAVYGHYGWNRIGQVPATWLSQLAEPLWLTGPDGPASPVDLALRTDMLELAHGQEFPYAIEADPSETRAEAVAQALGMQTRPMASGLVEELRHLREQGTDHEAGNISARAYQLYQALALLCPQVKDDPPNLNAAVDDMTIHELRAAFGRVRTKRGLIYAQHKWWPATATVVGSTSFGRFRGTVTADARLARLWWVLGVAPPTIDTCVDVVGELSAAPLSNDEAGTYVSTLRLLAELVNVETDLHDLPLWCGDVWQAGRPVLAVHEPAIGATLSSSHHVWQPRCDLSTIAGLLSPLGVTEIAASDMSVVEVDQAALTAGARHLATFDRAVGLYREACAESAPAVYAAFGDGWAELSQAQIAIVPELLLSVDAPGGMTHVPVTAAAHRRPSVLAVEAAENLGSREMGRSIVVAFMTSSTGDRPEHVAAELLWKEAWSRAVNGATATGVALPDAAVDSVVDDLAETIMARELPPPKKRGRKGKVSVEPTVTVTRLKTPSSVRVVGSGVIEPASDAPPSKSTKRRTLVPGEAVKRRPEKKRKKRNVRVDDQDAETVALEFVREALRSTDLSDFRNQQGIGADAIEELGFIELKRSRGSFPDEVPLTASEYQRAREEKGDFILAVVAGLLEGTTTEVCFYPDPLSLLSVEAPKGVLVRGLRGTRRFGVTFEDIDRVDEP